MMEQNNAVLLPPRVATTAENIDLHYSVVRLLVPNFTRFRESLR